MVVEYRGDADAFKRPEPPLIYRRLLVCVVIDQADVVVYEIPRQHERAFFGYASQPVDVGHREVHECGVLKFLRGDDAEAYALVRHALLYRLDGVDELGLHFVAQPVEAAEGCRQRGHAQQRGCRRRYEQRLAEAPRALLGRALRRKPFRHVLAEFVHVRRGDLFRVGRERIQEVRDVVFHVVSSLASSFRSRSRPRRSRVFTVFTFMSSARAMSATLWK